MKMNTRVGAERRNYLFPTEQIQADKIDSAHCILNTETIWIGFGVKLWKAWELFTVSK